MSPQPGRTTLQNKAHWEDVGYRVEQGGLPGQQTVILRPPENSPLSISKRQSADDLIQAFVATDATDEVRWVVQSIVQLLGEGLRADDIMVVALDDRNARTYLRMVSSELARVGVRTNDVLANPFGEPEFTVEGEVTLAALPDPRWPSPPLRARAAPAAPLPPDHPADP